MLAVISFGNAGGALAFLDWDEVLVGIPDWVKLIPFCVLGLWAAFSTVLGWLARRAHRIRLMEVQIERDSFRRQLTTLEKQTCWPMQVADPWVLPAFGRPKFESREERCARIVSFFNLKGGVGKTTLAANLAALFGMGGDGRPPLRVLVVDLDFQGTLTSECVVPETADILRQCGNTTARLLEDGFRAEQIAMIRAPMSCVPERKAFVLASWDPLEKADFAAQVQFLLDPANEIRFRYLELFHSSAVSNAYDVIMFDCPPRLTPSCVNALACSDHVVIPTKLDDLSIDAIARTLKRMRRLRDAGVIEADVLAIVPNEVPFHGGQPQVPFRGRYNALVRLMAQQRDFPLRDDVIVDANDVIPRHNDIPPSDPGMLPACSNAAIRALFKGVVATLRERLGR